MELKLVIKTGRSAVVEFDDGGKYYSKEEYTLLINGEEYGKTEKVVTTIYGLKPDTEYKITAVYAGKEYGPVEFKTDYEYVTLNVREFGAYGDGEHDDTNAIQCAIMAAPKDSRVLVPEGVYKISSIFLKDNLNLELAKGAVLSAFTERDKFPIFRDRLRHTMRKIITTLVPGKAILWICFQQLYVVSTVQMLQLQVKELLMDAQLTITGGRIVR